MPGGRLPDHAHHATTKWSLSNFREELLGSNAVDRGNRDPCSSQQDTGQRTEAKSFGPLSRVVILLVDYVLYVFQLAPGLSMSVIGHASEGTIWHWFEVARPAERRIVLVKLFITVAGAPQLVSVGRLRRRDLNRVRNRHYLLIIIIIT